MDDLSISKTPAATGFTLTYKTTNLLGLFQSNLYCLTRPPVLPSLALAVIAISTANSSSPVVNFAHFVSTFLQSVTICCFVIPAVLVGAAAALTLFIVAFSKLNISCTTIVDEDGVRDVLGPIKTTLKWSQVRAVELRSTGILFSGVIDGVHIPAEAFCDDIEKHAVYTLAKHFQGIASSGENFSLGVEPGESDALLKSLNASEEAKWSQLERKHKS